jgi:Tfp pilus assembly protein PilN
MAKPAPKKDQPLIVKVNLLHPQGEPLRLPSKFLKWLVGYGRFIVIFVEIVVIVCFLYRFKLDADLDRINQEIKAEAQSIDSKQKDEILIKQTQQKLQLVKQTYDNSPNWRNVIETITAKVPQSVTFHNLTADHAQSANTLEFKITAETKSTQDISVFINSLKELDKGEQDRKFKDVNLSNVSFDSGIINFSITGSTK